LNDYANKRRGKQRRRRPSKREEEDKSKIPVILENLDVS
jgi:hypothetical protein